MNTIKSDSLFLGLAVLLSLLFVSGLGGASVMALLGYQGMTLAEVVLRQELNAARALLAQQGLGSLALFLIPGLALQQRWARSEPATPSLPQRPWGLAQTVLAWSLIPALLPALTWLSSAWHRMPTALRCVPSSTAATCSPSWNCPPASSTPPRRRTSW